MYVFARSLLAWGSLILTCLLLQSCGGIAKQQSGGTPTVNSPSPSGPQSSGAVNSGLFGMHIHRIGAGTPWPSVVALPAWRLWDARVTWRDLEPSRGVFNFALLDKYVAAAKRHNTELLLTLAYTPQWASQRPTEPSTGGPGASAPPANFRDWDDYVTAVVTRYKGRIKAYEVLNEPNLSIYFTGTVADQFTMLRDAYQIIKKIDPSAAVVSPGYQGAGFQELDQLLQIGGAQYMDAIGYHFYDFPAKPENQQGLIDSVSSVLAAHNITKPIWDTEIGFGPSQTFTDENQQAAYFARTILLHWRNQIPRAYWYAWDNHRWVHLWMTEIDNTTLTKAGVAFSVLYRWISSATLIGCSTDTDTLNICSLTLADGHSAHILWMTNGQVSFPVPSSWQAASVQDLEGSQSSFVQNLTISESPVLVY